MWDVNYVDKMKNLVAALGKIRVLAEQIGRNSIILPGTLPVPRFSGLNYSVLIMENWLVDRGHPKLLGLKI